MTAVEHQEDKVQAPFTTLYLLVLQTVALPVSNTGKELLAAAKELSSLRVASTVTMGELLEM